MSGAPDHLEPRPGDLLRHVLAGGEKWLVLIAHDDEGGDPDAREPVHHPRALLREHAARGVGQPLGRAVQARRFPDLAALAERVQAPGLERHRALAGARVPGLPSVRAAIAGAGVADHQRARHLRMLEREAERDVSAEGEPADDRALHPQVVEQGLHVRDREGRRVPGRVRRALGRAVAAHAPADDAVAVAEGAMLIVPHAARGGVAVAQEHHRSGAGRLVVDVDAVQSRSRHRESAPFASPDCGRVCQNPRMHTIRRPVAP